MYNPIFKLRNFLVALLALTGMWNSSIAQNKYTVSVPTKSYSSIAQPRATDELDVQHLIDEVVKYAKIYERNKCMETLNPKIESHLKAEMKKINEGTPYIMTVDYESCEFISLLPDKGTGAITSKTATVYYITLNEDIPTEPIIKPDDPSTYTSSLLTTYINDEGQWVAIGPYLSSDGYSTEEQAIGSLFFGTADYKYVSKQGKFKIYTLNKLPYKPMIDVRFILKQSGITDLPK